MYYIESEDLIGVILNKDLYIQSSLNIETEDSEKIDTGFAKTSMILYKVSEKEGEEFLKYKTSLLEKRKTVRSIDSHAFSDV